MSVQRLVRSFGTHRQTENLLLYYKDCFLVQFSLSLNLWIYKTKWIIYCKCKTNDTFLSDFCSLVICSIYITVEFLNRWIVPLLCYCCYYDCRNLFRCDRDRQCFHTLSVHTLHIWLQCLPTNVWLIFIYQILVIF